MSMNILKQGIDTVDEFLFYKESALKAAIFRIALGVVLIANYVLMANHLSGWFSDQGMFPLDFIRSRIEPLSFSIFFWFDSVLFVKATYSALITSTILYTLGIFPRLFAIPMFLITISFHARAPFLFNAGDMVLRMALLANLFIDSGKRLSILNLIRRRPITLKQNISGWPFRIIQVMVCCIYFFAAYSKTSSQMWMQGEYVFTMANFPGRGYWNFLWLREAPWLANLMTYSVMITELSFTYLVWMKKTRVIAIVAAFLMHLGILLSINTVYFSEIMFVMLITFLPISVPKSELS